MVKCADCGYLALREWESRALVETEQHYREIGTDPPRTGMDKHKRYEDWPLCFAMAWPLREEIQGERQEIGGPEVASVLRVIHKERECSKYVDWQQGFTPREHREMLDRQWLLHREDTRNAEQRKFQRHMTFISGVIILVATVVGVVLGRFL